MPTGDATTELPAGDATTETPAGDAMSEMPAGDAVSEMPTSDAVREMPAAEVAAMEAAEMGAAKAANVGGMEAAEVGAAKAAAMEAAKVAAAKAAAMEAPEVAAAAKVAATAKAAAVTEGEGLSRDPRRQRNHGAEGEGASDYENFQDMAKHRPCSSSLIALTHCFSSIKRFHAGFVPWSFQKVRLSCLAGTRLICSRGDDIVRRFEQACDQACAVVGYPTAIRFDQGVGFVSRDLDLWACQNNAVLDFSRPGKPTDQAD